MIIQIRGTSGSGKTYVMREVMTKLGNWEPVTVAEWREKKRKAPLYYKHEELPIFVLGHYESTCGGCDNVGSAAQVYDLYDKILDSHTEAYEDEEGKEILIYPTILSEGLLLSEDTKWTLKIHAEELSPRVVPFFLHTDIETCISQIKKRREEAGNDKPLNEKNTRNRVATIERARVKLKMAGVDVKRVSSRQAGSWIVRLIKENV